jgi:uncharacterized membrane protein YgcG
MTTVMFTLEGTATILLYVAAQQTTSPETAAVQEWALWLLFLPIFMPITRFVYDGIFINVIIACCRKKFTLKMAIISGAIILLSIPSFLFNAFKIVCPGLETYSSSKAIGSSVMVVNDVDKQLEARKQKTVTVTVTRSQRSDDRNNEDGGGGGEGGGRGGGGGRVAMPMVAMVAVGRRWSTQQTCSTYCTCCTT